MKSSHCKLVAGVLTTGAFFACLAVTPALACKGSETFLRDDFTEEDPAWNIQNSNAQISGGALKVRSEPGHINNLIYQGQNFPGADVCIDIIAPADKPSNQVQGGVGFWNGKGWDLVYIATDGSAGVDGLQAGKWVSPVPNRKFDAIKTTPNATNQLRVTWKAPPPSNSRDAPDPTVTIYINDKQFIKYKVMPNANRAISVYAVTDGATYQFKNLVVTY